MAWLLSLHPRAKMREAMRLQKCKLSTRRMPKISKHEINQKLVAKEFQTHYR